MKQLIIFVISIIAFYVLTTHPHGAESPHTLNPVFLTFELGIIVLVFSVIFFLFMEGWGIVMTWILGLNDIQ